MLGTNVPQPTFGPDGFIIPTDSQILAGAIADILAAFAASGYSLNPGLTTPQGMLATALAANISNADQTFLYYTTQTDPAYAVGRMQDAIARIYFIERNPAQQTVVQCLCTGSNATIPVGALAADGNGNVYSCTQAGTLPPGGGSITLPFANNAYGPIPCPAGTLTTIYQAIPGWDTITNPSDGVLGNDVESASAFEARRAASVAANSVGSLPAIVGAVLAVPDVLDAYVTENATGSPVTILGQTLAAHSLYVAAVGGDANAIAQAIWSKKAPGCAYNGNTTVTVYDTASGYTPPLPAYSVTFEIPAPLQIFFAVTLVNNAGIPSNAAQLISSAIVNAFAGGDGGTRARIGNLLLASRYYAPVAALGSWAQIESLYLGSTNVPAATFTAAIAGTALTVSGSIVGSIAIGQVLTDATGDVAEGTTIISGSGDNWVVSISQTVSSEAMATIDVDAITVQSQINQVPVTSAGLVAVATT